ncbi:MAG: DNA processing protein [bacterium]|jgi:DNA processing protein
MDLSRAEYNSLKLFRSTGVGPIIYHKLVDKFGSAEAALQEFPSLNKSYKKNLKVVSERVLTREIKMLEKLGGQFVFKDDEFFPTALKFIHDCPPVLSVLVNLKALGQEQVAIVGNRNASAPAMKFTKQIAAGLVKENYVITSGLARGIDSAAHRGTLEAGGITIAVVAGGLDHIYPPENADLYHEIINKGGAIVSEMPLGMAPTQNHFPRRNRIVSGLSLGVAVIEAAKKSGSLITARLASEQGREVFAMPGSPADIRSSGPNYLIQNGATMLQTVEDILENLPKVLTGFTAPKQGVMSFDAVQSTTNDMPIKLVENDMSPENCLLNLLSSTPVAVDELIRLTGMDERAVIAMLTDMDLSGLIERQPGGIVRIS